MGLLIDRWGYVYLALTFLLGTVLTALTAVPAPNFLAVAMLSASAGFFLGGSTSGTVAIAAHFYPTFMRSTGLGWCMGMSRFGSASFPLMVGWLVTNHLGPQRTFMVLGSFAIICSIAIWGLRAVEKRQLALGPAEAPALSD